MAEAGTVPGSVLRDTVLEAAGCVAFDLARGEVLRIVDVEGQQVSDVVCFNRHNLQEKLSTHYTRRFTNSWQLREGDLLLSDDCQDMMRLVRDTVGVHFLSGGFCSAEVNLRRYGVTGEANCRDSLAAVLAPYGIGKHDLPGALCTFMNVVYRPDGVMDTLPPPSRAGDFLDLQAEMDLLVAVSNCPQVHNACNGFALTPLRLIVYRPAGA